MVFYLMEAKMIKKGIMFRNHAKPDCCAIGRIVILIYT
jgi:hypothetical protein